MNACSQKADQQYLKKIESKMEFSSNWELFTNNAENSGAFISQSKFKQSNFIKASIPTTVLGAQVKNGMYKDIYIGKNIENIDTRDYLNSWWYRKSFNLDDLNKSYQLQFNGINYKANIWLNGKLLADTGTVNNAFKQFRFDIDNYISMGENILAVEVFPPKPGDFSIGFVDWNPAPPDKNMGIFRPVFLNIIDKVQIVEPYVESFFEDGKYDQSFEKVSLKLKNYDDKIIDGKLVLDILGKQIVHQVQLPSQSTIKIELDSKTHKELIIHNPQLWWPHNVGQPHLYDIKFSFISGGKTLASHEMKFGIREIKSFYTKKGHRGFKINGEKISIKGGGWVDQLLLENTHSYDEAQLQYVKDMNLNAIRLEGFWGKDEYLYQRCDELGILMLVGWSCQWEWEDYLGKACDVKYGGILSEYDVKLISEAWKNQIVWLRNHPSIIAWLGGSDCVPTPDLEELYHSILNEYDNSRVYLASAKEWNSNGVNTAVKMRGPYAYVPPIYWYNDTLFGGSFGFNTETGPGAQVPPIESIRKMIPKREEWPLNETWDFHCGRNEFNTLDRYTNALYQRYGEVSSVDEFARKAQALNYELIRPMFEAFSVNRFEATGVIQWMLNSAWPEMYWQLYDYYLMPNGAYFGAKKASMPLQAIYHYGDKNLYLVNDQLKDIDKITVDIKVFDINSNIVIEDVIKTNISNNSSKKILEMAIPGDISTTYFLDLRIKVSDEHVANNFYWLSTTKDVLDYEAVVPSWNFHTPSKQYADYKLLNQMPTADVVSEIHELENSGNDLVYQIILNNNSDKIAFFLQLQLVDKHTQEPILPVIWEDNYLSLLPNERREIEVRVNKRFLKSKKVSLEIIPYH